MKIISRYLTVLILLGSSIMTNSCSEEFLTREPPGVVAGSVLLTPDGIEALLIGTYGAIRGTSRFGGAMGTDWTYGSIASDDCYLGSSAGGTSELNLLERYQLLPDSPYLRERWRDCYNGIARANATLENLTELQKKGTVIPETRALQIEAEARFLRAWFHFQANKIFERIPYIKTPAELSPLLPEEVPNTDPAWDEIEEDLTFAIENLPFTIKPGETGRADKYAAEAVKAHVHMFQKEFGKAKTLLDDIILNGGFELADNFYDNYDMTHENNVESIFEIQASTTSTTTSALGLSGCVFHQKGPSSCGGWGYFQPSQSLFEAFQVTADGLPVPDIENRDLLVNDMGIGSKATFIPTSHLLDPRVDWTIARRGIDFLGWGIHPGNTWIADQQFGGPYMTKKTMHFKSEQSLNSYMSGFDNGKNYRIYRFANILLWRAEIAVEENDYELARTLVNRVRTRAKNSEPVMGLCTSYSNLESNPVVDYTKPAANYKVEPYPPGHPAFSSQSEARKAVRMEIRLEFATEGNRFFDLRRWGIDNEVLNDYIARDIKFRNYLKGVVYDPEKNDYWPLPLDQVKFQKDVLMQDSSYLKYH